MAGERPKQFLELSGTPIIIRTLKAFEQCDVIQEIIVVLAVEQVPGFLALAEQYEPEKIAKVIVGDLHGLNQCFMVYWLQVTDRRRSWRFTTRCGLL